MTSLNLLSCRLSDKFIMKNLIVSETELGKGFGSLNWKGEV